MKAILITQKIENLAAQYAKNLFATHTRSNFLMPMNNLRALLDGLRNVPNLDPEYKKYVRTILSIYPVVNSAIPSRINKIHKSLFAGFAIDLSLPIKIGDRNTPFYKHVVIAMRYDSARDEDFLRYAKKLGIRACIYCNANYAVSFAHGKSIKGKFELDHYKPQSLYPYLCTNFYNLYPVCANCNKAKLNKDASFSLYTENASEMYPFSFELQKHSIIKYMLSQNVEDLKVTFNAPGHIDHDKIFKIEGTYNALKDVAEELVWKHKIYNQNYINSIKDAFGKKFAITGFSRFILGNYDQPSDIHKRPLSKMTQDIAKQLGILK